MSRRYFGTDGIRGLVGKRPITPDFMLKLGWAAGRVLSKRKDGSNLILIGKDTRISGYMFESALEAGLINAGVDVGLLGPMPTPAIAYLTQAFRAQAGIVISASHNPYYDNGIKFFCGQGSKLPDNVEADIEFELEKNMLSASQLGKARRISDAIGRYIEFCKGTIPRSAKLNDLKVVLDCANGATYQVAPSIFQELGATVDVMNANPDGLNINEFCGSTAPHGLQARVTDINADLGIAFDGDGDRVVFVDDQGEIVDGDELLYIISSAMHKEKGCKGVVGTLMSNYGLELAFKEQGIPFIRAKVGDRYVIEMMKQKGWYLGGESSGHIICGELTTTGDGIVSALQVVYALGLLGKPLAEAKRGMLKMPQTVINVRVDKKEDIQQITSIRDAVASAEARLVGKGRVLLRPSGTEPVIRVMVEGEDLPTVKQLAQELAGVVEQALTP
ncbi:phosphoglucosamine mutase [Candidatus Endobugula sertula]|uniref:Phosphoglucosamine mutase n=1 Tax=Candidatus Endobugula sertula TaxID=62101 RepID=A0A1D2QN93_9GAMM|nr:phosphoglucosamine mutase [Candidatus Endobugula sertula]